MRGILLAGGRATRLHPITKTVSKQLLPVYDKPMVYYPLSVLMLAGIRDILVISTPDDLPQFKALLGTGAQWGVKLSYAEQKRPDGIARAILIAGEFLGGDQVCAYRVSDPQRYGVVGFDADGTATSLEEKPNDPSSNFAVTGLYFYDGEAFDIASRLRPSARGELEITDLNRAYLDRGKLNVERLGRGVAWLDTGTPDALLQAANFVQIVELRQGLKIACLEEVAFNRGYIGIEEVRAQAKAIGNTEYGRYLLRLADEPIFAHEP
jgi:glucose-1-phosphate thymidylyltransferase